MGAIINQAISLFTDFGKANEGLRGGRQQATNEDRQWSPPEDDWIKMNVDGAQSSQGDRAGAGTIEHPMEVVWEQWQ